MIRAFLTWEIITLCILLSPIVIALGAILSPFILAACVYKAARRAIRKIR